MHYNSMVDFTEQIERLHSLKEKGVISEAEYEKQKTKLLAEGNKNPSSKPKGFVGCVFYVVIGLVIFFILMIIFESVMR